MLCKWGCVVFAYLWNSWAGVSLNVVHCEAWANLSMLSGASVSMTVVKWSLCKPFYVKWSLCKHVCGTVKMVLAWLRHSEACVSMSIFQKLNYEWMVKHCIMNIFNQVDKTDVRSRGFCVVNCEIRRLEWTRRDGYHQPLCKKSLGRQDTTGGYLCLQST